jgi:alpha-D-ribose 1-methylphosphonate 5-triphosphate synthase subunit PhnG
MMFQAEVGLVAARGEICGEGPSFQTGNNTDVTELGRNEHPQPRT